MNFNALKSRLEKVLIRLSLDLENKRTQRSKQHPEKGRFWFTREEEVLVDAIASLIVPSDENTPGTQEMDVLGSSVVDVLDRLICNSSYRQKLYRDGLISIDGIAIKNHNSRFADLPEPNQLGLFKHIEKDHSARARNNSGTWKLKKNIVVFSQLFRGSYMAADLFPVMVKDVMQAFYTSEVSWVWLGYDGPPMPKGYPELHKKRDPVRGANGNVIRELAASGYGIPAPNIKKPTEPVDVVVIGSGAGGSVVAKELAEGGLSVVVLEAGKRFNPFLDYRTDHKDFELKCLNIFDPKDFRRDHYTLADGQDFVYRRVKGVGGSTLRYVAVTPRFHESDFRVRTQDGVADDWPLEYKDLEPYYTRVEYELGVSGPEDSHANPFDPPRSKRYPTPAHPFNLASLAIKRGADKLGLHMVREPLAIPSQEWDGRPACINAGTCSMGCAIAAKSSMDVTYLLKAEKTGRVEIRSECIAYRITVAKDGRARSVAYFDREGREHEIRANLIVLAGNAVETPRLLMVSESNRFPHGLANSSGLVGKYFTEHLAIFATGVFPDRLDQWRGTPTGGMIQDFYSTKKTNAFARGWTVLVSNGWGWPISVAEKIPGWGAEHKHRMERLFGHTARLCSVGEQLPDIRNQVTLDPVVKDQFGFPVPKIASKARENDTHMINGIKEKMKEILDAAGASEILEIDYRPGESAHYLGTCRMGLNPETSVVNPWGRTHEIPNLFIADGSIFVTAAAVNPTLTISALATRIAAGILESIRKKEI